MTATQTVYLNQTEYRVPPVVHAVQNDTGRKVKMVIQDQVLPNGSTATLDFMRSDKSHYSVTCEAFASADNSFTAEIDQALTQAGITECQLKVSGIVSTFTFIIDVQPDVSGISVPQDGYSAEQIIEIMDSKGITEDIKQTLLACFEKVAWIDENGQDYYDALYDALYPPRPVLSITAVYTQSGTVYAGDPLDSLRPDLIVTAHYEDGGSEFVNDYYLSGTLYEGESTITVTYGGKTTTFDVQAIGLVSISAVYTQSGTVYDTDSLDSLKSDLVVTAFYSDSSTAVISSEDYTLSGTLEVGTSTITVSYGGKTATFSVTVSANVNYVTSGLVHRWDGIENTRSGHNDSTATWEDLVGDVNLTKASGSWTSKSLALSDVSGDAAYSSTLDSILNATIEVCFKSTGSTATAFLTTEYSSGNKRRVCLFTDNTIGVLPTSAKSYTNPESSISAVRYVACDYSGLVPNNVYINGQEAEQSNNTHSFGYQGANKVAIGGSGSNYKFSGEIYAIRIYNRALTQEEITQNYRADIARFELGA